MKQISVAIPDELKAKLAELAQKEERSVAWVVREILQNYFKD
jgi:predicted transcriptional regulator